MLEYLLMTFLIKISFFSLLISSAVANNQSTACERYFKSANEGTKVLSRCELKSAKINAEVIKLAKACRRNEEAPKQDCYIIRLCPKYTDQSPHQAPMLLKKDFTSESSYCLKENYTLLRADKHQFEATANCEGSKLSSARMVIEGQSIDCPFEW